MSGDPMELTEGQAQIHAEWQAEDRPVCSWGHPLIPVNTFHYPGRPGRPLVAHCRHCRICQQRGVRAGITLAQYYDRHPEAVEYRGFPVAGANTGWPS